MTYHINMVTISLWLKNSKEFSESLYFGHQNTWILLFNFQWAVLSAEPCGWQLSYYTTFSSVCQDLFQNFFAVFFAPASRSHRRSVPSGSVIRCSLTALIVYHTRPALSTPFSKFFQVFCLFLGKHGGLGGILGRSYRYYVAFLYRGCLRKCRTALHEWRLRNLINP